MCALVLGAWACSSGDATRLDDSTVDTVTETALEELGSLSLALSNNNGTDEIRLIGTLNVREVTGALAATILAAADSPAAQSVTLQPGLSTIEVLDGYSCTQVGSTPSFTGCTFVGATPNPFEVRGGEQGRQAPSPEAQQRDQNKERHCAGGPGAHSESSPPQAAASKPD